jgi:hypothetical protein
MTVPAGVDGDAEGEGVCAALVAAVARFAGAEAVEIAVPQAADATAAEQSRAARERCIPDRAPAGEFRDRRGRGG